MKKLLCLFMAGILCLMPISSQNAVPITDIAQELAPEVRTYHAGSKELAAPALLSQNAAPATVGVLVVVTAFADTADNLFSTVYADAFQDTLAELAAYYQKASYGQTSVTISMPQLNEDGSVTVTKHPKTRSWLEPYQEYLNPEGSALDQNRMMESAESRRRLYDYLTFALDNLPGKAEIDGDALDGNGDGAVDSVLFLFPSPTGSWAELLWPHSSSLFTEDGTPYRINDSTAVSSYTFQQYGVGFSTVMHETNHALGLWDLYSYVYTDREIAGDWSPMQSGEPAGMTSIEKESLGWITVPTLEVSETPQTITLRPLSESQTQGAVKIPLGDSGQYLYAEYRKESDLPTNGLLLWRLDRTLESANGNAYGPPYYTYLYRAFSTETYFSDHEKAAFSDRLGRTQAGVGTATPLYYPIYSLHNAKEEPPQESDIDNGLTADGEPVYFRLDEIVDSGISIYHITEGKNSLSFEIKTGSAPIVCDPVFSIAPGTYNEAKSLALTSEDGADIYYTLNGDDPTADSLRYTGPILLEGAVNVKAVCIKDGISSNLVSADYSCYPQSSGLLPYYDGTNSPLATYDTEYNTLLLTFEKTANAAGYLYLTDTKSGTRYYASAQALGGNTIRLRCTGTLKIEADPAAYYRISAVSGLKEEISSISGLSLLNGQRKEISSFSSIKVGADFYIKASIAGNLYQYKPICGAFCVYDSAGRLMEVKSFNEYIYQSYRAHDIGMKFAKKGTEGSFRLFIWDISGALKPLMGTL